MNRDESCLNLIAIESRTQGNHDGTQDIPSKSLNCFTINQELRIHKKNIDIYKIFQRENRGPLDSVMTDRRPRSHDDHGP